ncbi:MAG: choice-of-anchor V domain-containing protein, partial [Flavobacteriales bacterium]
MKYALVTALIIACTAFSAFQSDNSVVDHASPKKSSRIFSSGGQHSLTGAPGENNCTQCHSGSVLDGSNENEFTLVDASFNAVQAYVPGETYTATLQLSSNPAKKGFSSTTLDNASNSQAGSLVGASNGGTQQFQNTTMTREYVSHTVTSNTNAVSLWLWTWTAPTNDVGSVTFYVSSNVANDDGATSADQIYLSEHVIASSVGIREDIANTADFKASYSVIENNVVVEFSSLVVADMYFNLVDLSGKSVYTNYLNKSSVGHNQQKVSLPAIDNGIYMVNFFVGNHPMSA